jgi:cysteine dioxygenase
MTSRAIAARAPAEMFKELDAYRERIPIEVLRQWLAHRAPSLDELRPFMQFRADRYVRNLVYAGTAFQALLLCWRSGQRSPIHDHSGSSCAVRVLAGTATETLFATAPNGMVVPCRTHELPPGTIAASQDSDMHQMSNLQAAQADLVTLHIYSPPLLVMNMFSLVDDRVARFYDPINEVFLGGAGI